MYGVLFGNVIDETANQLIYIQGRRTALREAAFGWRDTKADIKGPTRSYWQRLAAQGQPPMVVAGAIFEPELVALGAADGAWPGARLCVLRDSGHFLFFSNLKAAHDRTQ